MGFFGNIANRIKNTFGNLIGNPKQVFGDIGNSLFNFGDKISSLPLIGRPLSNLGDSLGVKDVVSNIQNGNLGGMLDSGKRLIGNAGNDQLYGGSAVASPYAKRTVYAQHFRSMNMLLRLFHRMLG